MQEDVDNLWLARTLHHLGAVQFGDFSLGRSTVHSPIYIDLKVMLSDPSVLRNAARLIQQETRFGQALRRPKVGWFDVVAGVPFGGLHLATAFSLERVGYYSPAALSRRVGLSRAVEPMTFAWNTHGMFQIVW